MIVVPRVYSKKKLSFAGNYCASAGKTYESSYVNGQSDITVLESEPWYNYEVMQLCKQNLTIEVSPVMFSAGFSMEDMHGAVQISAVSQIRVLRGSCAVAQTLLR